MAVTCKGRCESGMFSGMVNIPVSVAYVVANRCTECSDSIHHVWYLKWVNKCPCCKSTLRRKPRKSSGRERFISIANV